MIARLSALLSRRERRCPACLRPFSGVQPFCPDCLALLPRRIAGHCPHCGECAADPLAPVVPCGVCLKEPPLWEEFRFYGVFEGLLRDLLHRAKYQGDAACLHAIGRMLVPLAEGMRRPDAIVPLPLHSKRLRERGFNQCRELARPLARELGIPLRDDLLERARYTSPQTSLSYKERLANPQGVFAAHPAVAGLHILLIDDTATTASSLRASAKALREAGATLDVIVVARTDRHHTTD